MVMQEGNLLYVDKLADNVANSRKIVVDIIELCFKDNAACKKLNKRIVILSKRGQLKQVYSSH
jgi:hypothetical protein